VLAVDEHSLTLGAEVFHRVADHRQVFVQRGAQGVLDMPVMTLGHDAGDWRLGVPNGSRHRIVSSFHPHPSSKAEGHQLSVLEPQCPISHGCKERSVIRIRARPATLDEADTKLVQQACNNELVRHRQVQTLLLRAVAQGGVEDMELGRLWPQLGRHSDPQVDGWMSCYVLA